MATEKILSTEITALNASPPTRSTTGMGGPAVLRIADGSASITSGVTAAGASFYRLVRVPSRAIIKAVYAWLDAAGTTITGDIGIYYSNNPNFDGTKAVNVAAADTAINADHFASAVALAAVVTPTEYTFEAGTFLSADTRLELWNTASSGLTSDPNGFFDIVFTLTSTAGSAAKVNLRVLWTMPAV